MIGEVRDETNLSTAEIANPTTPRSQYQSRNTSTDTAVVEDPRDVEGTRALVPEQTTPNDRPGQLFPDNELNELRARWDKAQIGFVDEPRAAHPGQDRGSDRAPQAGEVHPRLRS